MDKRGKTLLSIGIILFALIIVTVVFISPVTENTKVYDEETRTITINDGASEVATIKLVTPIDNYVMRGF